jgi:hypothetical protein
VFPAGVRARTDAEAPANLHRKPEAPTLGNNLMPGYIITISDVLALVNLDLGYYRLLVISYEEDSIRAFDCYGNRE